MSEEVDLLRGEICRLELVQAGMLGTLEAIRDADTGDCPLCGIHLDTNHHFPSCPILAAIAQATGEGS